MSERSAIVARLRESALACCEAGDAQGAVTVFLTGLSADPLARAHPALSAGAALRMTGHLQTVGQVRAWLLAVVP